MYKQAIINFIEKKHLIIGKWLVLRSFVCVECYLNTFIYIDKILCNLYKYKNGSSVVGIIMFFKLNLSR